MLIRTKFYLYYLAGMLLVLIVCGYAVVTYKAINQQSNAVYEHYSSQLVNALHVQVHYKNQISAWQNSLLYLDNDDLVTRYVAVFNQEEITINKLTANLIEQLELHSASHSMMHSFKQTYLKLMAIYHEVLPILNQAESVDHRFLGRDFIILDAQSSELLDKVVLALMHERDYALELNTNEREAWEAEISLLVITTILLVSIIFSRILNHTVINPFVKLKRYTERLTAGYYDAEISISSSKEASEVASELTCLSVRLGDYTSFMEDGLKQLTRIATELADSKESVVQKEARLMAIVNNIADGIVTLTSDFRIEMFNPAACKIFAFCQNEVKGRRFEVLIESDSVLSLARDHINKVQEVRGQRSDGRTFLMDCVVSEFGVDGLSHYVLSVRDVTLRKLTEQKLVQLANYDMLTHLPNRNMLQARLKTALELSSYKNSSLAVLHVNVNHFKRINDTFGFVIGDSLLKQVAMRIKGCEADADLVARLGGDEFMLLLNHVDDINVPSICAEKVLEVMSHPFCLADHEIYVDCSIGVALYPNDANEVEALLRKANLAMYDAKLSPNGQWRYYSKEMDVCALDRLQLETRLRQAITNHEFVFFYQPQVDAPTGAVVGVEALLRWVDPARGVISPIEFIPLLEESGLIIQMSAAMFADVCRQGKAWHDAGYSALTLSINLSARQFEDPGLLTMIRRVIDETEFNPAYLELEITETAIMADTEKSEAILKSLYEMGMTVAIDDFGTGYSSLSYLRTFSLQTLKIDRSFVKEIAVRPDDRAISQSIINMAHNLKMRVVAEGVETAAQRDTLISLGCCVLQGFIYSKPLPVKDMTDYLVHHHPDVNVMPALVSNGEIAE